MVVLVSVPLWVADSEPYSIPFAEARVLGSTAAAPPPALAAAETAAPTPLLAWVLV